MLLKPFFLLLVLACALSAQPKLEVNVATWGDPEDWTSNFGSIPLDELEIRLRGTEGEWYCILLHAFVDPRSALWNTHDLPIWVADPQFQLPESLSDDWNGDTGGPEVEVAVLREVFQQGLRRMLRDPLLEDSARAVCDWGVPLLRNGPERVWECYPEIWSLVRGHGWGDDTIRIWEGMSADFTDGVITRPTVMSVEAMVHWAILNQASLAGGGDADANAFLESEAYKLAIDQEALRLRIQALTAIGDITGPGIDDSRAPDLENHPSPPAINRLSENPAVTVSIQVPSGSDTVIGLGGVYPEDGGTRNFQLKGGTAPVMIGFPTTSGRVWVQALSDCQREHPCQWSVNSPANPAVGSILLTTGLQSTPVVVAAVTAVQQ